MLMQKFGRPFAVSVVNNDPPCVPARVLNKMAIYIPPPELVDAYLQEIARGYGITWTSDRLEAKAEEDRRADLEREVKAADDKAESNKNGGVTTKVRRAGNILGQDRLLIKIFTACCRHPTRPEIRRSQEKSPNPLLTRSHQRPRSLWTILRKIWARRTSRRTISLH
jgi:hypothetical protein